MEGQKQRQTGCCWMLQDPAKCLRLNECNKWMNCIVESAPSLAAMAPGAEDWMVGPSQQKKRERNTNETNQTCSKHGPSFPAEPIMPSRVNCRSFPTQFSGFEESFKAIPGYPLHGTKTPMRKTVPEWFKGPSNASEVVLCWLILWALDVNHDLQHLTIQVCQLYTKQPTNCCYKHTARANTILFDIFWPLTSNFRIGPGSSAGPNGSHGVKSSPVFPLI